MKNLLAGLLLSFPLGTFAYSEQSQDTMTLEIGKFSKDYEIKTPIPDSDTKISYVYDFYDDVDLIKLSAYTLAHKIVEAGLHMQLETVVVPGDKANSIGVALTQILRHLKPSIQLVVLRSAKNGGSVHKVSYQPGTKTTPKTMYIRPDQLADIQGKKVLIMDDVISTGSTVKAAKMLVEKTGGSVIGFACVATEGTEDPGNQSTLEGLPVLHLRHFPAIPLKE